MQLPVMDIVWFGDFITVNYIKFEWNQNWLWLTLRFGSVKWEPDNINTKNSTWKRYSDHLQTCINLVKSCQRFVCAIKRHNTQCNGRGLASWGELGDVWLSGSSFVMFPRSYSVIAWVLRICLCFCCWVTAQDPWSCGFRCCFSAKRRFFEWSESKQSVRPLHLAQDFKRNEAPHPLRCLLPERLYPTSCGSFFWFCLRCCYDFHSLVFLLYPHIFPFDIRWLFSIFSW